MAYFNTIGTTVLPSIQNGSNFTSAPAGTTFDPAGVSVSIKGNVGDIIEVDLKQKIAYQLLGGVPGPLGPTPEALRQLMDAMSDFKIISYDQDLFQQYDQFNHEDQSLDDYAGQRDGMTVLRTGNPAIPS